MRRTGAIAASGAVLVIAGSFLAYAVSADRTASGPGIVLHATFTSSDGIVPGSRVELAGLTVGTVRDVELDRSTFLADVTMDVSEAVRIPTDSSLAIEGGSSSDGVVQIRPGHDSAVFASGAVVTATEAATSLEQNIGNYIFGNGGLGADAGGSKL